MLIYAPGLGPAEIPALESVAAYLPEGETHLYLDVSPTSFRAGYWHGQPVQILNTLLSSPAGIYKAVGVRLGLLIVDDQAISFTPPLPRVEASPHGPEANAILYSPEMTELLWNSIMMHAVPTEITTDDTPAAELEIIPVPIRQIVTPADISLVAEMQRKTPPIEPDRERLVDHSSRFKLIHFSVQGYKLQNRTLAMPSEVTEILGSIGGIDQRVTSWRLFTDTTEKDPDLQKLENQRKNLEERQGESI